MEQHFRSLATFLSRRGLRRRFFELCCRHDIRRGKVMQQWTGGTFTWRWEKLYVFLHQLKRRFFVLSTNWNADLMSRGQADAEDDEETRGRIKKVTVALRFPGMKFGSFSCLRKLKLSVWKLHGSSVAFAIL